MGEEIEMTPEDARTALAYDPETGLLTWRNPKGTKVKAGDVAGHINAKGYVVIHMHGRAWLGHRLAWAMMLGEWPHLAIDHINGQPGDNRWANLRLATKQQNGRNRRREHNNSSGRRGVTWHKANRRWRARVTVSGKEILVGMFPTIEAAEAALVATERKLFGEFAR